MALFDRGNEGRGYRGGEGDRTYGSPIRESGYAARGRWRDAAANEPYDRPFRYEGGPSRGYDRGYRGGPDRGYDRGDQGAPRGYDRGYRAGGGYDRDYRVGGGYDRDYGRDPRHAAFDRGPDPRGHDVDRADPFGDRSRRTPLRVLQRWNRPRGYDAGYTRHMIGDEAWYGADDVRAERHGGPGRGPDGRPRGYDRGWRDWF